jgi:7,8-dihydroneopterin aldolase/epimerase/oxygenase
MDQITISDLEVFYRVGVTDAERARPQRLLLGVEILHDLSKAAKTDALTQTIDYHAVCRRLMDFGKETTWKLIETLATDIADTLISEFHAGTVSVQVKKFVIPEAAYVSVRLTRNRRR